MKVMERKFLRELEKNEAIQPELRMKVREMIEDGDLTVTVFGRVEIKSEKGKK